MVDFAIVIAYVGIIFIIGLRARADARVSPEEYFRFCCNFGPATSGWTVFDNDWTGSPIMPSDNPFKWRQFEPGLILLCVRWYLRYAVNQLPPPEGAV